MGKRFYRSANEDWDAFSDLLSEGLLCCLDEAAPEWGYFRSTQSHRIYLGAKVYKCVRQLCERAGKKCHEFGIEQLN